MSLKFEDSIRDILRIGRNIRLYYDRELQKYHIGWSQQFLLQYIFQHPGVTAQELSEVFLAEKSTISKGIKKLCEEGYVQIEEDSRDRRAKKLYPSQTTGEVVSYIGVLQERLNETLAEQIASIEKEQMERMLRKFCEISKAVGEESKDAE